MWNHGLVCAGWTDTVTAASGLGQGDTFPRRRWMPISKIRLSFNKSPSYIDNLVCWIIRFSKLAVTRTLRMRQSTCLWFDSGLFSSIPRRSFPQGQKRLGIFFGGHSVTSNDKLVPKPKHCAKNMCITSTQTALSSASFMTTTNLANCNNRSGNYCAWIPAHFVVFIPKVLGHDA